MDTHRVGQLVHTGGGGGGGERSVNLRADYMTVYIVHRGIVGSVGLVGVKDIFTSMPTGVCGLRL